MKWILVLLLTFLAPLAYGQNRPRTIYYPEVDTQMELYKKALAKSKRSGKPLLVSIGMNTCVWCDSMSFLLHRSNSSESISQRFVLVDIHLQGNAQEVINDLKKKAAITEKLPGYPYLFVVDPETKIATGIPTGSLEYNIEGEPIYGHHHQQVIDAINYAEQMSALNCRSLFSQ